MRGIIMKLEIKVKFKTSAILIKNCLYSIQPYLIHICGWGKIGNRRKRVRANLVLKGARQKLISGFFPLRG